MFVLRVLGDPYTFGSLSAEHFLIQIEILVLIPFIGQPDLLLNPCNLCSCLEKAVAEIIESAVALGNSHAVLDVLCGRCRPLHYRGISNGPNFNC